jgi:hypothetical protein
MNLLLFRTRDGKLYPIGRTAHEDAPSLVHATGRWHRLLARVNEGYRKLGERFNPQELVCANLRHAEHLQICHSSEITRETVEKRFRQFLELSYSKHRRWFWLDAVLAFFGIFLMFLPGPNVFFFYPAIRSLGHYHARNGTRKALELQHLAFKPEPLIDEIQGRLHELDAVGESIQELQRRYGLEDLKTFLIRLGKHES